MNYHSQARRELRNEKNLMSTVNSSISGDFGAAAGSDKSFASNLNKSPVSARGKALEYSAKVKKPFVNTSDQFY
jgi:hypothetical protein